MGRQRRWKVSRPGRRRSHGQPACDPDHAARGRPQPVAGLGPPPEDGAGARHPRPHRPRLRRAEFHRWLADREFVRRLADWLERRPRLGRQVFVRGAAEEPENTDRATAVADTAALWRACLAVLERPDRGGFYRPAALSLW